MYYFMNNKGITNNILSRVELDYKEIADFIMSPRKSIKRIEI